MPTNIGLLVLGLGASFLVIALHALFPDAGLHDSLAAIIGQVDFHETVMNGMLAFLLFAAALQVDFRRLRRRAPIILVLATLSVALSALIVGGVLGTIGMLAGVPLTFAWALVFGALIAPTDPVAVMSTLKAVDIPLTLKTDISGEALFNDGVAVVLFALMLTVAADGAAFGAWQVLRLVVVEAGGGAALGLVSGFIAYRAIRPIEEYSIEVVISLALVTGTYALANAIGVSGPIAVVAAGVLFGNRGAAYAMTAMDRRHVFGFWAMIDEILNAILFLLIGLEVLVLNFDPALAWIALVAVPVTVLARWVAVGVPVTLLRRWQGFVQGTVPVLTWAGVRGGISVALVLSLPPSASRSLIVSATYAVVVFTIIVQGLTLAHVVRRTVATPAEAKAFDNP